MIDTSKHRAIFNPEIFQLPVHVIGCGGMGSRVAEGLIRMGVGANEALPLYLYDHDTFEAHNVANQYVDQEGIGLGKPEYLRHLLLMVNRSAHIIDHNRAVKSDIGLSGLVFICVDSMSARKEIMESAIESKPDIECVIETRMDAYVGISHCFDPRNTRQCDCWWMYWHSDEEAQNMAGCSGVQSIISAIYGTTMLALKQFEIFARCGNTLAMHNRVYQDFETGEMSREVWPT